jgi:WXG100 family type VII secretion target
MELTTDSGKLVATAQALTTSAGLISTELQRLAQASAALTAAWTGEATVAYESRYRAFALDAEELTAQLLGIGKSLGALAAEYASADSKGGAAQPV